MMIHVVETMPFLPPMTGNGLYIPPINMVMTGGWCVYGIVLPTLNQIEAD